MVATEEEVDRILEFVRGEVSWQVLETIGLSVRIGDNSYEECNPKGIVVSVDVRDLALGILRYQMHNSDLATWARILLAADFLDMELVHAAEAGDALLGALWDASFGYGLNDASLAWATKVLEPLSSV